MVAKKIKDQIMNTITKEAAILIAGLIPLSALTIVTLWGAVTIPIWIIIWAGFLAGGE